MKSQRWPLWSWREGLPLGRGGELGSPGGSISLAVKEQSSLEALSCLRALAARHSPHPDHAAVPEETRPDSTRRRRRFLLLTPFLFSDKFQLFCFQRELKGGDDSSRSC